MSEENPYFCEECKRNHTKWNQGNKVLYSKQDTNE